MASLLNAILQSPVTRLIELYLAWFPAMFAFLAIVSSRQFLLDRQGIVTQRLEPTEDDVDLAHRLWPIVTVVIPVHDGADTIERTVTPNPSILSYDRRP